MQPLPAFCVGGWDSNPAPQACRAGPIAHNSILHLPQTEELKWVRSLRGTHGFQVVVSVPSMVVMITSIENACLEIDGLEESVL